MSKFNISMFDTIKQALQKNAPENSGLLREILKFEAGNTYLVRLLPQINDLKNTIFHYYQHSWESTSTGQLVSTLCPSTFGDRCPIDEYYLKIYRTGSPSEKEMAKPLARKEGWLVNVYVISDPTTPENEGQVKILRYGRELHGIIDAAINGDDVEEFGPKIFDLVNGCTLRIKCEPRNQKGGSKNKFTKFITYSASRFLTESPLKDMTEAKADEILEKTFDLTQVYRIPTYTSVQKLLNDHFFASERLEDSLESASTTIGTPNGGSSSLLNDDDTSLLSEEDSPSQKSSSIEEPLLENNPNVDDDTLEKLKKVLQGL